MLNILVICLMLSYVHADCDRDNGPSGGRECVLLEPYYSRYQWATCITDKYIETFSKGRHQCMDQSAVYCYYQCMIEIHDDGGSGPVFDDCACERDAALNDTTTLVPQPTIPDWCFSPSGDNCNWYRECLEKRYPCKAQGNSYALDFAEKFCKLYDDHYSSFDNIGQQWVNAVRKCLQVQLVPILRPFVHKTCDEIKLMAFNSHRECYLHPDANSPSICQIGLVNSFRVFWTVKSSLIQESYLVFKEMLSVINGCHYFTSLDLFGLFTFPRITLIALILKPVYNRKMYEHEVAEKLSNDMKWKDREIMYFDYDHLNGDHVKSAIVVHILLASRSEFDLNSQNVRSANVSEAVMELAERIQNGDLDLRNGIEIVTLSICLNLNCTDTSLSVTSPPGTSLSVTSPPDTSLSVTSPPGTDDSHTADASSVAGSKDHPSTVMVVGIVFGCLRYFVCSLFH